MDPDRSIVVNCGQASVSYTTWLIAHGVAEVVNCGQASVSYTCARPTR